MNKTIGRQGKRKGYGLFALAAAIYTTGVIAFSLGSYFQQSNNLLEQVDLALLNATHATEQILGKIFLECAVETETVYELGYASNREKLNRFAGECRFDILGAVAHKNSRTWPLIEGGRPSEIAPAKNSSLPKKLQAKISADVLELAQSKSEQVRIQTVSTKAYGTLRLAIRYYATSADTGYAVIVARNTHNLSQLLRTLSIRIMTAGIFLHVMAFPLILLYNRTRTKTAKKMARFNAQLQQDAVIQKAREVELEDAIHDLERFNSVALGREHRITELKAEVNTLLKQMKRQNRYKSSHSE